MGNSAAGVEFREKKATQEDVDKATALNLPIHLKVHHARRKQWPNREWPPNIGTPPDFKMLESLIALVSPLSKVPVVTEEQETPSAVDVVLRIKNTVETHIHATVGVGGWFTSWARSFITFLASVIPRCTDVLLFAGQGGNACQEELVFIYWVMDKLGFKKSGGEFNCDQTDQFGDGLLYYTTAWNMTRSDGSRCRVTLSVVGETSRAHVLHDVAPSLRNAIAPNLVQIAVVSCPADGIKMLQDKMNSDMNKAMQLAKEKGFRPARHWSESEESCRAYYEYFEMKHISLAEHGITPTSSRVRYDCGRAMTVAPLRAESRADCT